MQLLPLSVRMTIMSVLSDLQEENSDSRLLAAGKSFYINTRLNYVKHLVMRYPDTNIEIIPDVEWERFSIDRDSTIVMTEEKKKVYEQLEKDITWTWTDLQVEQYLIAEAYPILPKTPKELRRLLLDIEYNFIMKCTKEELTTRFLNDDGSPTKFSDTNGCDSALDKRDGVTLTPVID